MESTKSILKSHIPDREYVLLWVRVSSQLFIVIPIVQRQCLVNHFSPLGYLNNSSNSYLHRLSKPLCMALQNSPDSRILSLHGLYTFLSPLTRLISKKLCLREMQKLSQPLKLSQRERGGCCPCSSSSWRRKVSWVMGLAWLVWMRQQRVMMVMIQPLMLLSMLLSMYFRLAHSFASTHNFLIHGLVVYSPIMRLLCRLLASLTQRWNPVAQYCLSFITFQFLYLILRKGTIPVYISNPRSTLGLSSAPQARLVIELLSSRRISIELTLLSLSLKLTRMSIREPYWRLSWLRQDPMSAKDCCSG